MEIQKMRDEMLLKIKDRVAAKVWKKVDREDCRDDVLSRVCILFLERFMPTCPKTGQLYTEQQAYSFATGVQLQEAMELEGAIVTRLRCETAAYAKAKEAATTLEELQFVEDTYRPEVILVSYENEIEKGENPEVWSSDSVNDIDEEDQSGDSEDKQIANILNSPRVHPLAKDIIRLQIKLRKCNYKEIAKILGVTERIVQYRLKRVAIELSDTPLRKRRMKGDCHTKAIIETNVEAVSAGTVAVNTERAESEVVEAAKVAETATFRNGNLAKTEATAQRRVSSDRNYRRGGISCHGDCAPGEQGGAVPFRLRHFNHLLSPSIPFVGARGDSLFLNKGGLCMDRSPGQTEAILTWIDENPMVTIDQIPKKVAAKMLLIAASAEGNFAALMAKGLALRLYNSGGDSGQLVGRMDTYIANCRTRLRLALASQGNPPPLQLFSLEDVKPAHIRAVRMRNLDRQRLAAAG